MEDRDLIESYLDGDENAFRELYERYKLPLFNFIYSMIRNNDLANDIFQDVFVKVIKGLKDYRDINFRAWVFQIARNVVIDVLKNKKNKIQSLYISIDEEKDGISLKEILPSNDNPEKNYISNCESKRLYDAIYRLSDDYREIIFLKHFSGLTFKEISGILKVPVGTLLSRFKRAVEKLNEMLFE